MCELQRELSADLEGLELRWIVRACTGVVGRAEWAVCQGRACARVSASERGKSYPLSTLLPSVYPLSACAHLPTVADALGCRPE